MTGWFANPGRQPDGSKGRRVRVRLAGTGEEPVYDNQFSQTSPPGWAADTTRWSRTGQPHDVKEYRIL